MNLICGPIKMIWFFRSDFLHFSSCKLSEKTNLVAYHFYLFVGMFPKLFNFSESKEKSYLVELDIFKENAFYGLQKSLLNNFSRSCYIGSAIVNGTCMQTIKIGLRAKFRAKNKCFPQILFPVCAFLRSI